MVHGQLLTDSQFWRLMLYRCYKTESRMILIFLFRLSPFSFFSPTFYQPAVEISTQGDSSSDLRMSQSQRQNWNCWKARLRPMSKARKCVDDKLEWCLKKYVLSLISMFTQYDVVHRSYCISIISISIKVYRYKSI
jgi:hypothetical protein